ncbi:Hsp20/alpha crystallin family protein [Lunatibacter salilacus]|uniref:Hsp20/alpha crystallin family protein n=1 Tax=Lunatibacter salilacus TaxID=2483804 RepID=UPI00131C57B8|nr:Hsp20/alpha crystallin family protein [Lunatibacter salilacus]
MDLTVKNRNGLPSLVSDLLNPSIFFGKDLSEFEFNPIPSRLGITVPTANIKETTKEYTLELAAPGLERDDFSIEINNNTLTVSAEKEHQNKEEENGYSKKEYSFNSFCRTFSLPENIKEEKIEAKYDKGVLKIHIPKEKETELKPVKKIQVK